MRIVLELVVIFLFVLVDWIEFVLRNGRWLMVFFFFDVKCLGWLVSMLENMWFCCFFSLRFGGSGKDRYEKGFWWFVGFGVDGF